jgi:hypothetical protein
VFELLLFYNRRFSVASYISWAFGFEPRSWLKNFQRFGKRICGYLYSFPPPKFQNKTHWLSFKAPQKPIIHFLFSLSYIIYHIPLLFVPVHDIHLEDDTAIVAETSAGLR